MTLTHAVRGARRCVLVVSVVVSLGASACGSSKQCVASPGMCFPTFTCVDGVRRTGGASCEDGQWICERVACASDASACDGVCVDSGSD